MLTYLWDDCPRCFWLFAKGLHRPQMPFPAVFSRYHDALGRFCLGRPTETLHPALPPGRFVGGEIWVESLPFQVGGLDQEIYIKGRLDHLACFDDGSFGVIDFKTIRYGAASCDRFSRQLHAYARALEQAAPNGLGRTPVTHLGLYCMDPVVVAAHPTSHKVYAGLEPHYVEIPRDDQAFEAFLSEVVQCLTRPVPPKGDASCSCCKYWARRNQLEKSL